MKLWYTKAASCWNEALPLGNGRMGAMVYGGTAVDLFALNEDTVWHGGAQNRVNPDARAAIPQIQQLLKDDRIAQAQELAEYALTATPDSERHYEPLCNLIVQQLDGDVPAGLHGMRGLGRGDMTPLEVETSAYRRELDIFEGIHKVSYVRKGRSVARESFLSYPHQVLAVRCEGYPCRVLLRRGAYVDKIDAVDGQTILLSGRTGDNGVSYMAVCRAVGEGVKRIGATLLCAEKTVLYVAAATSYRFEDLRGECLARLDAAQALGYDALRQAQIRDVRPQMEACRLWLKESEQAEALPTDQRLKRFAAGAEDQGLAALYFSFGRYLLLSCSRPGSLPANLQGVWNVEYQPPWGGKYTININTEMNYWPAECCGLSQTHLALMEHLKRMCPRGQKVARDMYGARGWVAHHNTDLWGDCAPQDTYMPATYWPMGAAWLCTHIAERYFFTGDRAFLEEYYPLMEEAALFFEDFCLEREDGTLSVSPSCSPENSYVTSDGARGTLSDCAAMDSQILFALFDALERTGKALGKDTEKYAALKRRLRPVQIEGGRVKEWLRDCQEGDKGHRHISHLFALYPGWQITQADPEAFAAARATLECRLAHGGGHTGWSRAWIICMWTRLLDGEKAEENLRLLFEKSTLTNLFDNHPPFQIDGNFGSIAGIAEMLVQSHEGFLRLLPALPPKWEQGRAAGLRARGGYSVDIAWDAGAYRAEIRARQAGELRLWDGRRIAHAAGDMIIVTLKEIKLAEANA